MMANNQDSTGTMVIAALLVLAIVFAGSWISVYVKNGNPWALLPWFGIAAIVIIVLGYVLGFWLRGGDKRDY